MHDLELSTGRGVHYGFYTKLARMNKRTLIIGVNVATHKLVARVIDDQSLDLTRRLVFVNTMEEFTDLLI